MSADPYAELGVARDASPAEIRSAYRRLAKSLHPDANPGDRASEEKFKRVTAAFTLLNDPTQRARFDRGEIDSEGTQRGPFGRGFNGGFQGRTGNAADLDDLLSGLFGRGGRKSARKGEDVRYRLTVGFMEAALGGRKRVTMDDGRALDLTLPEGAREGQTLRLRAQGRSGAGGAPPGDALVEISVAPHPHFSREGDDVRLDLPISLTEAVMGAKVRAPTLSGPVTLTVPKGANSGRVLRLRGKGFKRADGRGDQLVRLVVSLPPDPDGALERFVKGWKGDARHDPRAGLDV